MVELELNVAAADALSECARRGLVVRSERQLAKRPGSHHWHLAFPGRQGTIELSEWQNRVWVKVHPRRDGGWATALAHELASLPREGSAAGAKEAFVERVEVAVMLKRVADRQEEITRGWAEVERAVGSLRGRKFYGVLDIARGEYQVCVERRDVDDPSAIGLESGTLPGGRYLRVRLEGEPPDVYRLIAPTFQRMAERPDRDPSRPEIEFYRRRNEIDLLLPVV